MSYLLIIILISVLIVLYVYIKKIIPNTPFFGKLLLSIGVVSLSLAIVIYPKQSFDSALNGLNIWFNVVCPSLLPFFIGSQILVSLGIVSFAGTLFEPVMRPLFKVPGYGSFPFVMSITSGYPVGAKIVADLYENNMCSRTEAQRLLSFCSTSGPLFMIGAVGIGMLDMKECGTIILLSHYIGVICVGLLFRFYGCEPAKIFDMKTMRIKEAFQKFKETLIKEKRPIGLILSSAISNSINVLLSIGGFIILFSVIIRLLEQTGIISILSGLVSLILSSVGFSSSLSSPIASGFFEISVGSKLISSAQGPLIQKLSAISGIIAWSGLSVHAQVASMISHTDLKISIYIISKALHMFFSGICAFLIVKLGIITVSPNTLAVTTQNNIPNWIESLFSASGGFITAFSLFVTAALLIRIALKLHSIFNH